MSSCKRRAIPFVAACCALLFTVASSLDAQQGPLNPQGFAGLTPLQGEALRQLRMKLVTQRTERDRLTLASDASDASRTTAAASVKATEGSIDSLLTHSPLALQADCVSQFVKADKYSYGCNWKRLKLEQVEQADEYFGGFTIGNAIALALGSSQTVLYTELLSDNIWLFDGVGFGRIGLSVQASGSEGQEKTTVTQFFQGGGNAVLHLAVPVTHYLNFVRPSDPLLLRQFDIYAVAAIAGDIPKMSAPDIDPAGSGRLGIVVTGFQETDKQLIRFFVDANAHVVQGFSQSFYNNLTGDPSTRMNPFVAANATVGVDLQKLVRLGMRFSGSNLVGQKPQFTVQLLPQKK